MYTNEQRAFLFAYIPGHHYQETRDAFNERYPETPITSQQVKSFCNNNHVRTGFNGRFEKGQVSRNKGVKMSPEIYDKCKDTMFKKGVRPHNFKPVGSTRINIYGYVEIKVKDPNKWVWRHKLVWEKANGKLPPDSCILHKNGIRDDDRLENLVVLTRSELVRLNKSGLFTEDNPDVNEAAIALAKLNALIGKRKRKK